jgi:hypothetical protein
MPLSRRAIVVALSSLPAGAHASNHVVLIELAPI